MAFDKAWADETPFPPPDISSPKSNFANFSFTVSKSETATQFSPNLINQSNEIPGLGHNEIIKTWNPNKTREKSGDYLSICCHCLWRLHHLLRDSCFVHPQLLEPFWIRAARFIRWRWRQTGEQTARTISSFIFFLLRIRWKKRDLGGWFCKERIGDSGETTMEMVC